MKELTVTCSNINDLPDAADKLLEFADDRRVLAFYGKMGAGKTTFIKDICLKLGVEQHVSSPTFALINEYKMEAGSGKRKDGTQGAHLPSSIFHLPSSIFHFDFYRIKSEAEAFDIGCEEYFYSTHFCLVEWPEKVLNLLPKETVSIYIEVLENEGRKLTFKTD